MDTQSFSKTPNIIYINNNGDSSEDFLELRNVNENQLLERKSLQDIFVDYDFEDVEVFYLSKMNGIDKYELDIKKKLSLNLKNLFRLLIPILMRRVYLILLFS